MLQDQDAARAQSLSGGHFVTLGIFIMLPIMFASLWVYAATVSSIAISLAYVLASFIMLSTIGMIIVYDCRRMEDSDAPETGKAHTAVMLTASALCISFFFLKSFYGYDGLVVPVGTMMLCNLIDVFSLVAAPVLWCTYRILEHTLKGATASVQHGSSSGAPREEAREFSRDVAAERQAENQFMRDRLRERDRSTMEGIDEVDQVYVSKGMVPMQQFARGS